MSDNPFEFGTRRRFLADVGMGMTGLALGHLLAGDGIARGAGRSGPGRSGPVPPGRYEFPRRRA